MASEIGESANEGMNTAIEFGPPPPGVSELQITGGGAIAVDTFTLRHTAARFIAAEGELQLVARRLAALQHTLVAHDSGAREAVRAVWALQVRLDEATSRAGDIADRLRRTAAIYELVELDAAGQAAFAAHDAAEMRRVNLTRARILERYPGTEWEVLGPTFDRAVMWPSELVRQGTELGFAAGSEVNPLGGVIGGVALGGSAIAFGLATGMSGSGLIRRGERLSGARAAVTLHPVAPTATATPAPTSLADVAHRVPGGGDARVRVERYAMPDGTKQFAVYVAGTQSASMTGDDPWNNESNVALYTRHEAASYTATEEALRAAGAKPGDVVHAAGHSHGAMIAARLAMQSEYDVQTLVTFGSPVEAQAHASTLSVGVRHTDDPIAGLAGGGHMGAVGAPGSMVAERSFDAASGLQDVGWGSHALDAYAETAALVDDSGDPRVEKVRDVFAGLETAESVRVFEYGATRDESAVAPGPGGGAGSRPPVR